jgi:Fungal specific transcription factor domain
MTYWYETPDDQKDTWHWMGVAISLSHTIGLHRNPGKSKMDHKRQRLWKRIWWSCFMRDRLVALGMRRPTRIKSEDYDVPMLTLDDFELSSLNPNITCIAQDCLLARDPARQRVLAIMCIEKAKLCVCISHVLSAQYSVLNNNQGALTPEGNTTTTMMLLPRKLGAETCEVRSCDDQLSKWIEELPKEVLYHTPVPGAVDEVLTVHCALLHMVYYTTLSALHRPQVLPSAPAAWPARNGGAELHEISRNKVRRAAAEITRIGKELRELDLVKYLPTTGVTVLLPAIIIHLLDIKSLDEKIRNESLRGFSLCMQVIDRLRENYAAADYATHFLEAAIRKADIRVVSSSEAHHQKRYQYYPHVQQMVKRPVDIGGLSDVGRRMDMSAIGLDFTNALTPPPDQGQSVHIPPSNASTDELMASKLESFSASTPPDSEPQDSSNPSTASTSQHIHDLALPVPASPSLTRHHFTQPAHHETLDSFLHIPSSSSSSYPTDPFFGHYDDGAPISMHGESSGFTLDMDWMNDSAVESGGMSFLDTTIHSGDFGIDMDDVIAQGLAG